jgi:hypothetical protein
MTAKSNSEFAEAVLKIAGAAKAFRPAAYYDHDGDCIEFLAKPDPFYAERIDDLVTVYYSQANRGEIVGSLIKGVSKFLPLVFAQYPGFKISIQDGRLRLEHLFLAQMWMRPGDQALTLTYQKLIRVAEETRAEAEMDPAFV